MVHPLPAQAPRQEAEIVLKVDLRGAYNETSKISITFLTLRRIFEGWDLVGHDAPDQTPQKEVTSGSDISNPRMMSSI
jgi:hypothetical protein